MNDSIKQSQVKEIPPSIFYIPEFISKDEESTLLKQVYEAPKPRWTHLSNRRLQNWGGLPHPKGMVSEDLPKWLQCYTDKISDLGVFGGHVANHVLVNEYEAGQGIMPHVDGPLYFPTVSTISLGSHTLLDFYQPIREADTEGNMSHDSQEPSSSSTLLEDRYMCSILLEPRSLILVKDDMYEVYLHGIEERKSDIITDKIMNLDHCGGVNVGDELERTTRVSLTIRYVPKLLKAKLFLGRKR